MTHEPGRLDGSKPSTGIEPEAVSHPPVAVVACTRCVRGPWTDCSGARWRCAQCQGTGRIRVSARWRCAQCQGTRRIRVSAAAG